MILFNHNDSLISDLLTPTGGSNLTFKVSFDLFIFLISNDYLTFETLAWSTKPVLSRWGIFVAIANNILYGCLCTYRLYLAAMHYNVNGDRPQAETEEGVPLFKI